MSLKTPRKNRFQPHLERELDDQAAQLREVLAMLSTPERTAPLSADVPATAELAEEDLPARSGSGRG